MTDDRVIDIVDAIGNGLEEYVQKVAAGQPNSMFRQLIEPNIRALLEVFDEALANDLEDLCAKWHRDVGTDLLNARTAQLCMADVQAIITSLRAKEDE